MKESISTGSFGLGTTRREMMFWLRNRVSRGRLWSKRTGTDIRDSKGPKQDSKVVKSESLSCPAEKILSRCFKELNKDPTIRYSTTCDIIVLLVLGQECKDVINTIIIILLNLIVTCLAPAPAPVPVTVIRFTIFKLHLLLWPGAFLNSLHHKVGARIVVNIYLPSLFVAHMVLHINPYRTIELHIDRIVAG